MANTSAATNVLPSKSNDESSESWGLTRLKVHKFSYTWKIENFTCQPQSVDSKLKSPIFRVGINSEHTLRLKLYPTDSYHPTFAALYLCLVASKDPSVKVQCTYSILNDEYEKNFTLGDEDETFEIKIGHCHGFRKFINRKRLLNKSNGYLINNNLTILCEGGIVSTHVNVSKLNSENNTEVFDVPACMALKNLGLLFDSQKFCDVTVAIEDREFRAHKAILAAQSVVFAAMFENKMAEQLENRVNIEDMDGAVLEEMLRFIYTGEANLNGVAAKLLMAAEKYQLERLKVMCEKELASTITIDNAIDILIIADLYSAWKLKAKCMDFVIQRSEELAETSVFQSLFESHPLLAAEVFRASVKKRVRPSVSKRR